MAIPERAFLRRAEAERLTGFSASTLYRLAKQGEFPRPVKIGTHASAWVASEVMDWCAARIAERDKVAA